MIDTTFLRIQYPPIDIKILHSLLVKASKDNHRFTKTDYSTEALLCAEMSQTERSLHKSMS